VLTKLDLLPHLDYQLADARSFARQVNPDLRIFETSCRNGQGLDPWIAWLLAERAARPRDAPSPNR